MICFVLYSIINCILSVKFRFCVHCWQLHFVVYLLSFIFVIYFFCLSSFSFWISKNHCITYFEIKMFRTVFNFLWLMFSQFHWRESFSFFPSKSTATLHFGFEGFQFFTHFWLTTSSSVYGCFNFTIRCSALSLVYCTRFVKVKFFGLDCYSFERLLKLRAFNVYLSSTIQTAVTIDKAVAWVKLQRGKLKFGGIDPLFALLRGKNFLEALSDLALGIVLSAFLTLWPEWICRGSLYAPSIFGFFPLDNRVFRRK